MNTPLSNGCLPNFLVTVNRRGLDMWTCSKCLVACSPSRSVSFAQPHVRREVCEGALCQKMICEGYNKSQLFCKPRSICHHPKVAHRPRSSHASMHSKPPSHDSTNNHQANPQPLPIDTQPRGAAITARTISSAAATSTTAAAASTAPTRSRARARRSTSTTS